MRGVGGAPEALYRDGSAEPGPSGPAQPVRWVLGRPGSASRNTGGLLPGPVPPCRESPRDFWPAAPDLAQWAEGEWAFRRGRDDHQAVPLKVRLGPRPPFGRPPGRLTGASISMPSGGVTANSVFRRPTGIDASVGGHGGGRYRLKSVTCTSTRLQHPWIRACVRSAFSSLHVLRVVSFCSTSSSGRVLRLRSPSGRVASSQSPVSPGFRVRPRAGPGWRRVPEVRAERPIRAFSLRASVVTKRYPGDVPTAVQLRAAAHRELSPLVLPRAGPQAGRSRPALSISRTPAASVQLGHGLRRRSGSRVSLRSRTPPRSAHFPRRLPGSSGAGARAPGSPAACRTFFRRSSAVAAAVGAGGEAAPAGPWSARSRMGRITSPHVRSHYRLAVQVLRQRDVQQLQDRR